MYKFLTILLIIFSCQRLDEKAFLKNSLPFFGKASGPKILAFFPEANSLNVPKEAILEIYFSETMNMDKCKEAFSITPSTEGSFISDWNKLQFKPRNFWKEGTYIFRLSKNCENTKGEDLQDVFSSSFNVSPSPATYLQLIEAWGFGGNREGCSNGDSVKVDILSGEGILCTTTSKNNSVTLTFSDSLERNSFLTGISIIPQISYSVLWDNLDKGAQILFDTELQPNQKYSLYLSDKIKSINNLGLQYPTLLTWKTNPKLSPPQVQGFGLESQNCPESFPALGSLTGGDWNLGSCFWDIRLPILDPFQYQFRGGDLGDGSYGSSLSCTDVATDNFRVIFDSYMEINSVISGVRLQRISPPLTTVRLANWKVGDCNSTTPRGCRAFTFLFSEQEASCNGTVFGTNTTGGDFNLSRTDNSPDGFSIYTFSIENTAWDIYGNKLEKKFEISMEGK